MRTGSRKLALVVAVTLALYGCDSGARSSAPPSTRHTSSTTITTPTTPSTPTTVPRAPFFADPNPAAVGRRVTFSGRGCSPNADVVVIAELVRDSVRGKRPHADGAWSTSAVIADNSPVGTVDVFAQCDVGKVVVDFKPLALQITTYRRLLVRPGTAVRAGTTLTLTATGGCNPVDAGVVAPLYGKGADPLVQSGLVRRPSGTFTGTLRIPPRTPPGDYSLSAACVANRTYSVLWPAVKITVK